MFFLLDGESVVGAKPQSEAEPQEQVNLGWSGKKKWKKHQQLFHCVFEQEFLLIKCHSMSQS